MNLLSIEDLLRTLPEYYVEEIVNGIPFSTVCALVSNGTSPYQKFFLNRVFRDVMVLEAMPDASPVCDIESLYFDFFFKDFDDRRQNTVSIGGYDTLVQFVASYPNIRLGKVEIQTDHNTEDILNLLEANNITINKSPRHAGIDISFPETLYGLHHFEIIQNIPENLQELVLQHVNFQNIDILEYIKSLPSRLKILEIDCVSTSINPRHLELLPKSLRKLCLRSTSLEGDGIIKTHMPPLLESIELHLQNVGDVCLDISHLKKLIEVKLLTCLLFKLPEQLQRLFLENLDGFKDLNRLCELKKLRYLSVTALSSNILDEIVLPKSLQELEVQNPFQEYELPMSTLNLKFDNLHESVSFKDLSHITMSAADYSKFVLGSLAEKLTSLTILNQHSLPKKFWTDIEKLKELRKLSITKCEVESTPKYLPPKLIILDLSQNRISSIAISGTLKKLVLDRNEFTTISNATLALPSTICELSLQSNRISSLEEGYAFPKCLQLFDLLDNEHCPIEDILTNLPPRIVQLRLSTNKKKSFPNKTSPSTAELQSATKNKYYRREKPLLNVTSSTLWKVYLGGVRDHYLDSELVWTGCPNLQCLEIRSIDLGSILLKNYPSSLKKLVMLNTNISQVEGDFLTLPSLIVASLVDNPLEEWLEKNKDHIPLNVKFSYFQDISSYW